MKSSARLPKGLALVVLSVFLITPLVVRAGSDKRAAQSAPAGVVRVTPPAPVFSDEDRRSELAERRARVAAQVGPNGLLLLLSAEPRLYTGDVDYEFRQENNLFYLTHLNQEGSTLAIVPGSAGPKEILFLPRRNPARETWEGYMYSAEDAWRLSGVGEILDAAEFENFVRAVQARRPYVPGKDAVLLSKAGTAWNGKEFDPLYAAAAKNEAQLRLLIPQREADSGTFGDSREWRREQRLAEAWKKGAPGYNLRSAFGTFAQMRLRKSPSEIRSLQHAVDITAEALGRAMAVAGRSQWEYEVEAEVDYTFKRRNADNWGYPSIVGCGPNATTLHYRESQGRVRPGELLLMDVGAEYQHYTADVTRTFPAGGKFSKEQAEVYEIVLAAQEAGLKAVRPGITRADVHKAAVEVVKDGLLRLGLITERDSNQYQLYFMHGTTHWLGMNVHDVGGNEKLEPGMVFTVEPGIYVRADALEHLPKTPEMAKFAAAVGPAFEKYKNIGVRIEDDVVVTEGGHRNLSIAVPRTIQDIESFMARAAAEVRVGRAGAPAAYGFELFTASLVAEGVDRVLSRRAKRRV